jgi:hypothetical protein
MKRIIRTLLVGTATVGFAAGIAVPATAVDFPPGVCRVNSGQVYCELI